MNNTFNIKMDIKAIHLLRNGSEVDVEETLRRFNEQVAGVGCWMLIISIIYSLTAIIPLLSFP